MPALFHTDRGGELVTNIQKIFCNRETIAALIYEIHQMLFTHPYPFMPLK